LWDGFFPLTPGFNYVPFDDIDAIESSINQHTVAIMLEPIQGENGVIIPSENYLKNLRKICDENNLLLIMDEVQTGFGRTGKYFAYQWEDIKPDILTLAKGIANGIPLGAVLVTESVAEEITPGSHGTTFGGNYLALASSNIVLNLLNNELLEDINIKGNLIFNQLKKINFPAIKEIRYKGLMFGLELVESLDVKFIVKKLLENKLVTTSAGNNTIRLLPPFIITEKEIEKFIELFSKTFKMNS
jgi:acetylornithine/succinyldiaminopimelate/putrescine aminotransferase